MLRPCNDSAASAKKKRKRQKVTRDSKEENNDIPESLSMLEEEHEEGSDNKPPCSHASRRQPQEPGSNNLGPDGDSETEDDLEPSFSDEEYLIDINGQSAVEASACLSSFGIRLGHSLSRGEVEELLEKKWSYKWEVPAIGMSICKWTGTGENCLKDLDTESCDGLKLKLYKHWLDVYETSGGKDFNSSKQRMFFSLCNIYRDILHCNKRPFYLKGVEDAAVMDAYIMHSMNHVFRTRDLVTKNDSKLAKHRENTNNEILTDDRFLDQGFTRPKVLILLPLASIAFRAVKRLIQLTPSAYKVNVEQIDRFSDKFGNEENEAYEDDFQHDKDLENGKSQKSSKPSDFQGLFGGKNEDDFMVGIKFTRRSIKLFSDFYTSDIIVASPLGLVNKIAEAQSNKEKDVDYLSSIEVLIIDHADVIAMQNWDHVDTVVEHLNKIPSKQHGTDVMRIRPWYLDGYAKFYRQTIILGYYLNPEINALFNNHCFNYQGKVKLVSEYKGVLHKVLPQARQIYERFNVDSVTDAYDARFDYFVKKVFPKIQDSDQGGIMLFISSYLEFVRIRNFLKSQNASFCLLGEYTKQSDISRARLWFFEGRRKIMLYTERSHFYHRYKIRGVQNLIIYSLPERKDFYPEIVNMLDGSQNMTCSVLLSRFDMYRLERIVGTATAKRMLSSEKAVFVFC
ncbi:U3 small nucleolar RNA-associated protein 25 [Quillaja saponaria]|uniref:U3 small nucleolar RNA-associated protein 25 n=1 Tax=Quillaja saponaria TaxID=32244 RepID=A0AAD7PIB9_QUISA|nr:U3 small nucleolar RNA-associated protein 25 [Quillaja saponaria]